MQNDFITVQADDAVKNKIVIGIDDRNNTILISAAVVKTMYELETAFFTTDAIRVLAAVLKTRRI